MFTGLINDIGVVERITPRSGGVRLVIRPGALPVDDLTLGESIASSGACLTVVERGGGLVSFDAVPETLARTTLGEAQPGQPVNLEVDLVARHVARLREFTPLDVGALQAWGYPGGGAP